MNQKQKILCVLYDDPVSGYPTQYARESIPELKQYPDGQSMPSPAKIDFNPGDLLGSISGGLGLKKFLEDQGHEFVVTSDKDVQNSVFDQEIVDADIVISQPFWPAYLTAERIAKAPNLKLAITAGIGSDHVDLQAAIEKNMTVCEVTYCNSISVAEHAVMQILALVRDYIPQYKWVIDGGWNIADSVSIHCPLHPETEHLFNENLISKMKKGSYIVNTARGKICERDAIVKALETGQLAGYAGDVWFPQPPPNDHSWRMMPNHAMTPHTSGTSLSAQARYAAGVREILECWFAEKPIRDEYLIVQGGGLAGTGAHSYSEGNTTGGSDEASKFKV